MPESWFSGFQAILALWTWVLLVVLHGFFWRSLSRPTADPPRVSGPIS